MAKKTCAKACLSPCTRLTPSAILYLIRFWGRLIEVARCDAAYLRKKNLPTPFQSQKLNGSRVNRFAKQCATIGSEPDVFITLTFDASIWQDIDQERYDEAYDCFEKFKNYVLRTFDAAWFVWSMEISTSVKALHYHLVGSFGESLSAKDRNDLPRRWRFLTGTKNKKMFDMRAADASVGGYLFRPDKNKAKRKYAKDFPGRRLFGMLGKKNISPARPPKTFRVDAKTKMEMESTLRKLEYTNAGRDAANFDEYVRRERYSLSFCSKKSVARVRRIVKEHSI